ncbi:MAG: hypothetical protein JNG83_00615 [Opitutaceae bacterium]|nr:hypothetical protein [Opitutaceae bacterium]
MPDSSALTRRDFARGLAAGALALGAGAAGARAGTAAPAGAPLRRGIHRIIRNPKALESPPDAPAGETWRYMLSYPFQVAPNLAGLYCNLKMCGGPGQDFEGGSDIILFDQASPFSARSTHLVSRNYVAPNPNNGGRPAIMMKYPGLLGFVPLGARRPDGSPHPHAGTGFALSTAAAWPLDASESVLYTAPDRIGYAAYGDARRYRFFEVYQLRYDGAHFTISAPVKLADTDFFPGFRVSSAGMACAIADGDDLLTGLTVHRLGAATHGAGLTRWRRVDGEWRPLGYEPVTPEDSSMEPSIIRDLDGSLLMHARAPRAMGPPIRLWRQASAGAPWEPRLNLNGMIPSVPVTLNRAVDGTPYLVANLYQPQFFLPPTLHSDGGVSRLEPVGWRGERSTLCLWPLNEGRNGFDAQFIVRDPRTEFGLPPHGTVWAADHGTGGIVRLADGKWRALVGYRMLEWKENTHFILPPSPQTGSYLDEVVSFGDPMPLWNFGP